MTFHRLVSIISFVESEQLATENLKYGGIAQLGERLNGIQEVSGSIPLISTNFKFFGLFAIITTEYGGIAQLGERLNGIQEVSGSIPLISTI